MMEPSEIYRLIATVSTKDESSSEQGKRRDKSKCPDETCDGLAAFEI